MTERTIRWTISAASREFNIDRKTLAKRFAAQSIQPGKDKRYSTKQICQALFTELDRECFLLLQAQRKKFERENQEEDLKLMPVVFAEKVWILTLADYRRRVEVIQMPATLKTELLEILSEPDRDRFFSDCQPPAVVP